MYSLTLVDSLVAAFNFAVASIFVSSEDNAAQFAPIFAARDSCPLIERHSAAGTGEQSSHRSLLSMLFFRKICVITFVIDRPIADKMWRVFQLTIGIHAV